MVVYLITNSINGKQYVGQTIQPMSKRFSNHCGKGNALYSAITKYGKKHFSYIILSECTSIKEMNDAESFWIDHYQTAAPGGYNLTTGGEGYTRTEANKLALSLSHIGINSGEKHPMYGKTHTEEARQKMAAASLGNRSAKGYKHTEKARKAMSSKKKGRAPWNKGLIGAQVAWNKGLKKVVV